MRYDPPGGVVGWEHLSPSCLGRIRTEWLPRDLQAFKNVLETGEVVHSDSSIYTRCGIPRGRPRRRSSKKSRLMRHGRRGPLDSEVIKAARFHS